MTQQTGILKLPPALGSDYLNVRRRLKPQLITAAGALEGQGSAAPELWTPHSPSLPMDLLGALT